MHMRTLVLNKSWMPIGYLTWRKSFSLIFRDKAEVLEYYTDVIKTPSTEFFVPAVVRLTTSSRLPAYRVIYSRTAVLHRDKFSCQYCSKVLTYSNATMDHIVPRSKGGKSSFMNVVASCFPCNNKKGAKLLSQTRMKLNKKPYIPKIPSYQLQISSCIAEEWVPYLPKGMVNGKFKV